ncbi:MAG: YdeI/OmpD-associated family protein [Actinomycetota bacterium]
MIEVPAGIVEALGAGKRPPVRATVNGYTFRTTVAVYGGKFYVGLRKDIRQGSQVQPGQRVEVGLEVDEDPREVELPSDFARALDADPRAKTAFEALSFTHRKEHVQAIVESKKDETRRRRIDNALQTLRSGPKAL